MDTKTSTFTSFTKFVLVLVIVILGVVLSRFGGSDMKELVSIGATFFLFVLLFEYLIYSFLRIVTQVTATYFSQRTTSDIVMFKAKHDIEKGILTDEKHDVERV